MPIRRTCGTHASWLVALSLALLMLSVAMASASARSSYALTDPQVSPRETTFGTAIEFSVTFTDDTGAVPRSVQVQIEDSVRALAPASRDYVHGVRFSASVDVSVGRHAISFIATPAVGSRVVLQSGSVTVHHATSTPTTRPSPSPTTRPSPSPSKATPSPSPQPTPTPQSGDSGGPTASGTPTGGPVASSQAPASQSAKPTAPSSGRVANPTPKSSLTGTTPVRPLATPTHPAATPDHLAATPTSAGAAASDVPTSDGGQGVYGAEGSGPPGSSGHGPGLVQVARGGSGTGTAGGVPSYLLISYHAPLSQLIVDLAPSISTAAGGTAAWAAFVLFGKRRRDGVAADPESALATAAATGLEVAAGQGLTTVDESLIPRWRRPSLQKVRRTDPLRAVVEAPSLSFAASGLKTGEDYERRQIRYRLVRLLDSPDELRSSEIGVLDRGDEVLLLERRGVYWLVLCPDGRQGWLHRMTLADPSLEQSPAVVPWEDPAMSDYASPDVSADYAPTESTLETTPAADTEPADPGFLEAYMQARSEALRSMSAPQAEPPAEPPAEPAAEAVAASVPVAEPSIDPAPAGESGCAGERCSGRKNAGTRKAATGSRPGTKSRRPSR